VSLLQRIWYCLPELSVAVVPLLAGQEIALDDALEEDEVVELPAEEELPAELAVLDDIGPVYATEDALEEPPMPTA
jgi:hypothetical protein